MSALRRLARPGTLAILALGFAWAFVIHDLGWAQTSNFAQVRALDDGRADIDPWHWETMDKAYIDGHFYSVKAPGLVLATLPAYAALERLGAQNASEAAAQNARAAPYPKWIGTAEPPYRDHGFDRERALSVQAQIEDETPFVWALTLFGAVLPGLGLLFGVRWAADRLVPGFGVAAAVTLGMATLVMTFASEYMSHISAAALAFGAFLLLMREREGEEARTGLVALAGLLAGLAVTFEYPLGLVGLILVPYALSRGPKLRRLVAYGAAGFAGALPLFIFNAWAFGSPLDFAYGDAVAVQGFSGHAVLGLNDDGFFGITIPKPGAAFDLMFASRGIVTITPILLMGVAGAVFMRRDGQRAEANVILAVTAAYFLYTTGYWLPFGGGTPGPRFLTPAMPFLVLGIAAAFRRIPAMTLGLAIVSAVSMVLASITYPLIGDDGVQAWVEQLWDGDLEHTLLTVVGVSDPWLAIAPVIAAVAVAATLALRATPLATFGSIRPAIAVIAGWVLVSVLGPTVAGDPVTPLGDGPEAIGLVVAAALLATLALTSTRRSRALRAPFESRRDPQPT